VTTAILGFMSDLRPSFEERDRYVDLLSTAYADGRLDEAEFETRTNAVLSAVSHREALAQFQGLPQPKVVGRRGIMGFALAVAAVVYVVFTIPLIRLASRLEKKRERGSKGQKPTGGSAGKTPALVSADIAAQLPTGGGVR